MPCLCKYWHNRKNKDLFTILDRMEWANKPSNATGPLSTLLNFWRQFLWYYIFGWQNLKVHGNEADFLGFCRNWFLIDPLHYLSTCSAFGFEFAEIFVIEKRLPVSASRRFSFWMFKRKLGESESRRLLDSASRGVANSPTRRVGESLAPRLIESESRRLPDSSSRGVTMVSRGVGIRIF